MKLLVYSMPHVIAFQDVGDITEHDGMDFVVVTVFSKPVSHLVEIVIQAILAFGSYRRWNCALNMSLG